MEQTKFIPQRRARCHPVNKGWSKAYRRHLGFGLKRVMKTGEDFDGFHWLATGPTCDVTTVGWF